MMETDTKKAEKAQKAEALFREGYSCSQAVACAFAEELGMPVETVARLVSGFGGGMGRLREVCGCVSGMVFVAGALRGYNGPAELDRKADTYAMVQTLAARFREQNGSIVCRELLGLPGGSHGANAPSGASAGDAMYAPTPEARTPEYYKKRPCPRLAGMAAQILDNYLRLDDYLREIS